MKKCIIVLISIISISISADPIRSSIASRNILLRKEIVSYSASDYVQDDLIAMWDGIENAGWGTHDETIKYWPDLIGNKNLATTGTTWSWKKDSLSTQKCGFACDMSGNSCFQKTFTVEYCGMAESLTYAQYMWCIYSWYTSYWRYAGLGTAVTLYYNVMCNGRANNAGFTNTGISWHNGDWIQMTVIYDMEAGQCDIYFNGIYVANGLADGYVSPSSMTKPVMVVGGATVTADTTSSLCTHCVRIYSRALSSDEIAINYLIDKARYAP